MIPTQPQQNPYGLPPQQAQDPRSIYLSQALSSLGQQPMRSGGALGTHLLADALLQYGLNKRRGQLAQQDAPNQAPLDGEAPF